MEVVRIGRSILALWLIALGVGACHPGEGQAVFVNGDDVGYIAIPSDSVGRYSVPRGTAVLLPLSFDGTRTILIARRDFTEIGRVTMTQDTVLIEIKDGQLARVTNGANLSDAEVEDSIQDSPYCRHVDFGIGPSIAP